MQFLQYLVSGFLKGIILCKIAEFFCGSYFYKSNWTTKPHGSTMQFEILILQITEKTVKSANIVSLGKPLTHVHIVVILKFYFRKRMDYWRQLSCTWFMVTKWQYNHCEAELFLGEWLKQESIFGIHGTVCEVDVQGTCTWTKIAIDRFCVSSFSATWHWACTV